MTLATPPTSTETSDMTLFRSADAHTETKIPWLAYRDSPVVSRVENAPKNAPKVGTDVTRELFRVLSSWWHADTDALSDVEEKFEHPAYQEIIHHLRQSAIPLILKDLRDRGGHWFEALEELTGDKHVNAHASSVMAARDAWLNWGTTRHHI